MNSRGAVLFPALGLGISLLNAAATWLSRDLSQNLRPHLFLLLLSGLLWLCSIAIALRGERTRGALLWLLLFSLCLRLPGWFEPPRHTDDVHRYLWDGVVSRSGLDPYAGPPDALVYGPLRAALSPRERASFERINNRHLPTIYPPLAQLAFRSAPGLWAWKALVAALDLLVLFLLLLGCHRAGRDLRLCAAWGWSPLCALELAQNAHMDVLAIAPLVAAVLCFRRPLGTGALFAVALLAKPLSAALLPAALCHPRRRRLFLVGALFAAVLLFPFRTAGLSMLGSLGEFGRRWRANAGAFAIVQGVTDSLVSVLYRPPHHEPWRFPALARLVSGRPRATVFADELSAFLARLLVFAFMLALALAIARATRRRRQAKERGPELSPATGALLLLLAYLLLTPVFHPWYVLWALSLCPLAPALAPPVLALATLAPLAYLPLPGWLSTGRWQEPLWSRLLLHGTAWLLLVPWLRSHWPADFGPIEATRPVPTTTGGTARSP